MLLHLPVGCTQVFLLALFALGEPNETSALKQPPPASSFALSSSVCQRCSSSMIWIHVLQRKQDLVCFLCESIAFGKE